MSSSGKIKEAREIAQEPRAIKDWYGRVFTYHFSIYISYFLAKLHALPNGITIAMGIAGLCGSACMVPHNLWLNLVGAFLWQLWYTLDVVDGEVARLLNKTSVLGIYLERVSHIIVNSTFVLALGLHVYFLEPSTFNLITSIAIYSGWHWKREIGHLVYTTWAVEAGFGKGEFLVERKRLVALIRRILGWPFREAEGMLFATGIILISHIVGVGFTRWSLYVYTLLIFAYVGRVILLHSRQIYKKERPE